MSAAYLREIGAAPQAVGYRLELPEDDLIEGERAMRFLGMNSPPFLLLPGSGSAAKNWPARSFRDLGRMLGRGRVIVVIGPAETAMESEFDEFARLRLPSLGCLAGVASHCRAFVGNDSGVSHLASAAGARGVVIFGATDPGRWRPSGQVRVCRRMPLADLSWLEVAAALRGLDSENRRGVC